MKNSCFAVLVFFFYGCATQTQTKTNTPDEMVHKFFACLKDKDEKAFMALCPDVKQLERIMKKSAENTRTKFEAERKVWRERTKNYPQGSSASSDKTDSLVDAALRKSYSREDLKAVQEIFRSCFRFMIQKGEKKGVHWSDVTLINYTFDTAKTNNQQTMRFFLDQSGYKSMKGIIRFKAGNDTFKMSFGDVLFLPEEKGWYGAQLAQLVHESESLEDDHEGEEKVEITLTNVVDVPPPPPPPPAPKAKGKTKQ